MVKSVFSIVYSILVLPIVVVLYTLIWVMAIPVLWIKGCSIFDYSPWAVICRG